MYPYLLHLPLFNFAYLFFLSFIYFLSSQHVCYFCFHCFIFHLAPCFSFVFQFVHKLVLFLTGKYNFWFPFSLDHTVLYFCWTVSLCSWVYIYMGIFHHFNYYLPDFVTAIDLGFIFGFSFLDICVTLPSCHTTHLWNLCSWPEIKPWAFWVGVLTPRP